MAEADKPMGASIPSVTAAPTNDDAVSAARPEGAASKIATTKVAAAQNASAPAMATQSAVSERGKRSRLSKGQTSLRQLEKQKSLAGDSAPLTTDGYRGRMGRVMGVRIMGTGSFVPDDVVTNDDLAQLGCDSDWIIRRTGIRQRCHAAAGESTGDLAFEASRRAIAAAGTTPDQIDLVLVATITPDHITPSTACHLQQRLGILAPAMDLSAASAGFVYAVVTAANFIRAGNARRVLVVGADLMSRTIDPDDKKTYPLFGDGAGAVVIGPDDGGESSDRGICSYQLGSEGDGGQWLCIPTGGTRQPFTRDNVSHPDRYLRMDGRNVFKWAVRLVDQSTRDVLRHADWPIESLDHLVLHQANQRIIDSAVSDLDIDRSRVFVNLDRYGNTSAASVPLALDEMTRSGNIQPGQRIVLCGFGSGLAWATAAIQM